MATIYDSASRQITCPAGDTGLYLIELLDAEGNALTENVDGYGVFAVAQRLQSGRYSNVFQTPIQIVNNTVTVLLSNRLTRQLTPGGDYGWDVRIVTDPMLSEDGLSVSCDDDSDEVHSLFAIDGALPQFVVPGVAVNV